MRWQAGEAARCDEMPTTAPAALTAFPSLATWRRKKIEKSGTLGQGAHLLALAAAVAAALPLIATAAAAAVGVVLAPPLVFAVFVVGVTLRVAAAAAAASALAAIRVCSRIVETGNTAAEEAAGPGMGARTMQAGRQAGRQLQKVVALSLAC